MIDVDAATNMPDKILDATGLKCPLPVLRTRKALKDMPIGNTLEVLATDPASVMDIGVFCGQTGQRLVSQSQDGDVFTFLIRRTSA